MTQIGKSNVKWSEIRDALNRNGGSVSNKAEDAFKESSKYQKWARWKPTKYQLDFHPAAGYELDSNGFGNWTIGNANYGVEIPKYYSATSFLSSLSGIEDMDDLWIIDPPIGTSASPYRLGDFAGHGIEASMISSVTYNPSGDLWPGLGMNIYFEFYDNQDPVNSDEGNTDWIDFRDYWMDSNMLTSSTFGYIAISGDQLKAKYDINKNLNDYIISGYKTQIEIDIDSTDWDIEEWTIYPAIFYTNSTLANGEYNGTVESFSLADGFTPLPCKPWVVNFKDLRQLMSITIDSITYNTDTSGVYINATFNNEWSVINSSKDTNPIQVQAWRQIINDSTSSVYETFDYTGSSDNPESFVFNTGSTSFTASLPSYNVEEGYEYGFAIWIKFNLQEAGRTAQSGLTPNNGVLYGY